MDYWHFNFICPFFKWDEQKRIGCEGKHILKFNSPLGARLYMKTYCASWNWKNCPHAAELNKKYEEKNNGKLHK